MLQLKNILVPTDFSEPSMEATRYAIELARTFGATLHLLYVIDEPSFQIHGFGGYIPDRDEFEAFADTGLANWIPADDEEGLTILRRRALGKTYVRIVEDAREHDIDLIVMGTHGRSAITRGLLGSVAENVVRKASCPVLTVRPSDQAFARSEIDEATATESLNPSEA